MFSSHIDLQGNKLLSELVDDIHNCFPAAELLLAGDRMLFLDLELHKWIKPIGYP
jgi:hypothetical protein